MIEAQYGPLPKLEMFRRGKARPKLVSVGR
jgi:hypothetical protein